MDKTLNSSPVRLIVIAGVLLSAFELYWRDADVSWILVCAITLLPALLYAALTWAELTVVGKKRRERSGTLVGAYMLFKGVRLLLTIVAVAAYIYVDAPLRMLFVVNMLTFFLVALVSTSLYHLRAERQANKKTGSA